MIKTTVSSELFRVQDQWFRTWYFYHNYFYVSNIFINFLWIFRHHLLFLKIPRTQLLETVTVCATKSFIKVHNKDMLWEIPPLYLSFTTHQIWFTKSAKSWTSKNRELKFHKCDSFLDKNSALTTVASNKHILSSTQYFFMIPVGN